MQLFALKEFRKAEPVNLQLNVLKRISDGIENHLKQKEVFEQLKSSMQLKTSIDIVNYGETLVLPELCFSRT